MSTVNVRVTDTKQKQLSCYLVEVLFLWLKRNMVSSKQNMKLRHVFNIIM